MGEEQQGVSETEFAKERVLGLRETISVYRDYLAESDQGIRIERAIDLMSKMDTVGLFDTQDVNFGDAVNKTAQYQEQRATDILDRRRVEESKPIFDFEEFQTLVLLMSVDLVDENDWNEYFSRVYGESEELVIGNAKSWLLKMAKEKRVFFLDISMFEELGKDPKNTAAFSFLPGKASRDQKAGWLFVFPDAVQESFSPGDFLMSISHEASHEMVDAVEPEMSLDKLETIAFLEELRIYNLMSSEDQMQVSDESKKMMKWSRSLLNSVGIGLRDLASRAGEEAFGAAEVSYISEVFGAVAYGRLHAGAQKLRKQI